MVGVNNAETADNAAGGQLLFTGDLFCDLVFVGTQFPSPGAEVYADGFALAAGGVANRAVAAARMGVPTLVHSALGDDPLGNHLFEALDAEPHLDTTLISRRRGQSPVSIALSGPEDRSFITFEGDLGNLAAPEGLDVLDPVSAVHVALSEEVPEWVDGLRGQGAVVVGGVGWDHTGQWSPDVLGRLERVDVFVPNEVEAMRYTRTEDVFAAARVLAERVPLVIVTRGGEGVVAVDSSRGEVLEVEAIPVTAVDPTGAGDVFVATFMAGERHGWDLEQRLRFAVLSASLSVTGIGGATSAPHWQTAIEFVANQKPPGNWSFLTSVATAEV